MSGILFFIFAICEPLTQQYLQCNCIIKVYLGIIDTGDAGYSWCVQNNSGYHGYSVKYSKAKANLIHYIKEYDIY